MGSAQFIRERGRKIFQTNYAPGFTPRELLSAAAGALNGLTNRQTGQKVWKIDKPMPLANRPGALYVYAVATYPVASIGGTVGLTLGATPQEEAGIQFGIQFMAVLEDSMGWDIATAEQIADVALVSIERGMTPRYPEHGGWAMTAGAWRFGHHFAAPAGVPPDPPLTAQSGDQPEDFFCSPVTARVWGGSFPAIDLQACLNITVNVLIQPNQEWTLEYFDDELDGETVRGFTGHRVLPNRTVLYINGQCHYEGKDLLHLLAFADRGNWTAGSMAAAMNQTVSTVNAALQAQLGGVLSLLPPP